MWIDKVMAVIPSIVMAACLGGCGTKKQGGWCDVNLCGDGGAVDFLDWNKGGVFYANMPPAEPEIPDGSNVFRPEVLIVAVERERGDKGDLQVAVRPFSKMLNDVCKSEDCKRHLGVYGDEYAVVDDNCTGTFVSPNQIVTAEHCFRCTNWTHTYAVFGFRKGHNWPVVPVPGHADVSLMRVPADRVLQLCHVEACESYDQNRRFCEPGGNCDLALVHVCRSPVNAVHRFNPRFVLDEEDSVGDGRIEVYSHAWGLPLKAYSVKDYDGGVLAHFTNGSGGSGAPLVNEFGEVVAVVAGTVPPGMIVDCPSGDGMCGGQRVAPHREILRVFKQDQPSCGTLEKFFDHHMDGCRKCPVISSSIQTER